MRSIVREVFIALLLTSPRLHADAPRHAPEDYKAFSSNHHFFLISKVKENRTTVFRTDKPTAVLWQVPVYIQIADLSDDGHHIAASYEGGNILSSDIRPSDPLITFYAASGTKRVVPVSEIVPDLHTLHRLSSGYGWGRVLGFLPNGRLQVILESGKTLTLDPEPPAH